MPEFLEDKTLKCRDCNSDFTFTGGEQKFFAEKEFTPPSRCKGCRQKRKEEKENGTGSTARTAYAPPGGVVEAGGRRGTGAPAASMSYAEAEVLRTGKPDASRRQGGGGKRRRGNDYGD